MQPTISDEALRILALLDDSRQGLAALEAAIALAEQTSAELVALYVEDLDLLRCAGFPFSQEVGASSGVARPLDLDMLESSLVRRERRVALALQRAAAGRALRHRLQVSRGQVASEALAEASPDDVLVLGKAGLSAQWGGRLGSTCRRLIQEAPCTVVIWDERHPPEPGPLRYFRGEAPVLPWGDTPKEAVQRHPLFVGREELASMEAPALERFLSHARRGALAVTRQRLLSLLEQDADLLARIPVPIVVVP